MTRAGGALADRLDAGVWIPHNPVVVSAQDSNRGPPCLRRHHRQRSPDPAQRPHSLALEADRGRQQLDRRASLDPQSRAGHDRLERLYLAGGPPVHRLARPGFTYIRVRQQPHCDRKRGMDRNTGDRTARRTYRLWLDSRCAPGCHKKPASGFGDISAPCADQHARRGGASQRDLKNAAEEPV